MPQTGVTAIDSNSESDVDSGEENSDSDNDSSVYSECGQCDDEQEYRPLLSKWNSLLSMYTF